MTEGHGYDSGSRPRPEIRTTIEVRQQFSKLLTGYNNGGRMNLLVAFSKRGKDPHDIQHAVIVPNSINSREEFPHVFEAARGALTQARKQDPELVVTGIGTPWAAESHMATATSPTFGGYSLYFAGDLQTLDEVNPDYITAYAYDRASGGVRAVDTIPLFDMPSIQIEEIPDTSSQEVPIQGLHPQYAGEINSTPGTQAWFAELQKASANPSERGSMEQWMMIALRLQYPHLEFFRFPPIAWVQDEAVQNITGANLALPVVTLPAEDYLDFRQRTGVPFKAGVSLGIPTELFLRHTGKAHVPNVPQTNIVVLPDTYDGPIPFIQRRRHEMIHGVDPYREKRRDMVKQQEGVGDEPIITELIAVIGEAADLSANRMGVNVLPGFFIGYIGNSVSTDLLELIGVDAGKQQLTPEIIDQGLRSFVRKITGGQRTNAETSRLLMKCITFEDVRNLFDENVLIELL